METLVYVFLLTGTLMVIFFSVFFRDPPRIPKEV
uniref:Photosystem II reaction center protein T n=1 Tax=Bulboplastis apyrenoidosa TaxID=1070855 RepID=A0A1Y9TM19_9RHOD|nr:photosystem II reaction center protein T [Bulboplastis apyrenoidosa]ARO90700.1 photosystem II reaction center protein T [Bulboplastis apyrenoidosa]